MFVQLFRLKTNNNIMTIKANRLSILFYAFLITSVGLFSCGKEEPDVISQPEVPEVIGNTIFPGQGFGSIRIGELGSTVQEALGEDYQPFINTGTSGNATYNYYYDAGGVDIRFGQYEGGLDINTLPIESINFFGNFDGMTEEGIGLGSTRADVIAAYGEPDEIDVWLEVYNIGMLLSYDDEDKVDDIYVLEI